MKNWLTQCKREFWEYNTSFLITPAVIAAIVIIVGIYIVIVYGTPDSELADSFSGPGNNYGYQYGRDDGSRSNSGSSATAENDNGEFIIDFSKEKLTPVAEADLSYLDGGHQFNSTAMMYAIQQLFLAIMAFILLFYALSCLYADRKDRSVLFWKSMPVSEHRNVAVKFFIVALALPVVVTLISWLVQLCSMLLASLFFYRIGSDPWNAVWSNADVLAIFFQQLKYVLWNGAWYLPLTAWLLFISSLARRSPFLLATIPFVFVILMEGLLFGTWSIWQTLAQHFMISGLQVHNIIGEDSFPGATPGRVNLLLNGWEMLTGFVIAGLLYPATVWLRNHRFEI